MNEFIFLEAEKSQKRISNEVCCTNVGYVLSMCACAHFWGEKQKDRKAERQRRKESQIRKHVLGRDQI